MSKFTASRISQGNSVFPNIINISEKGVTLQMPSLFGGKEQTIHFDKISGVDIETPMVGFSTIKISSVGIDVIVASGFTKADVLEMRRLILK
jgi:hypothetical protein